MISRLSACFSLIFLVAACAGGNLKTTGPSTPLPASYQSVKVVFQTTAKNSTEIVSDMRGAILGQLLGDGRFTRVAGPDDAADLILNVDITNYRHVEVVERVFMGVSAGSNRLTVAVSVTDGQTGAVLRQFEATGESSAHPISGEAGFSDALRQVAKQ